MSLLDLAAFAATPLRREPYEHLVVPNFVAPEEAATLREAFPSLPHGGLTPLDDTHYDARFARLVDAVRRPEFTAAFSEKFAIDLAGRPLMLTVRSHCQRKDGRIHTDSVEKLVTALLYFNESWEAAGGALRILRGADDIEDYFAEVPPLDGTLIAFRRSECSYHGHKPHIGPRRYLMMNWMESAAAARREILRHHISTGIKRIFA
jgi:hypothetical protein